LPRSGAEGRATLEHVIEGHVADHADAWFGLEHRVTQVRVRTLDSRPRALLLAVNIDAGSDGPQILAKVRLGGPAPANLDTLEDRPRLAPHNLTVSELTASEYGGLRSIHALFGDSHPMFGTVRPLDHLLSENVIFMEYVRAGTLRQSLLDRSRLSSGHWSARHHTSSQAWWRAGAWLRTFQESTPTGDRPARQTTRQEVRDLFDAYHRYLTERLGPRRFGGLARQGAELAERVLPDRLPMAVGHGDYAPRNVFLLPDARLAVFDPMTRWAVPREEDLCRFLVGIRLFGLQVHTHGIAYSRSQLEGLEQAVIEGYFGENSVPNAKLRCFELLIMLDKWSALLAKPQGKLRTRINSRFIELASHYLRDQGQRLLDLADPTSR
jgi:hypothetical protein